MPFFAGKQKPVRPTGGSRNRFAPALALIVIGLMGLARAGTALCQGWPDIKIRLLPDDSFALVEQRPGQRMRHCPHHDQNGRLDEEQLIYVLGTLDQESWMDSRHSSAARKHLEKHYTQLKARLRKRTLDDPVNINTAPLTELVMLPQIGPVLAVKITAPRDKGHRYMTVDEVRSVDGIGVGTFNAIRYYICTD